MRRLLTTTVTSLEMRRAAMEAGGRNAWPALPARFAVSEILAISLARYRRLYRSVGDAHHWTSRLMGDENLRRELDNPANRVFVLHADAAEAGWFELDIRSKLGETRIVHFAVMPAFRGRGLAHPFLECAVAAGFAEGANRLIIETNTLDHPAALALYKRHGFVPYARRRVQTPALDPTLPTENTRP